VIEHPFPESELKFDTEPARLSCDLSRRTPFLIFWLCVSFAGFGHQKFDESPMLFGGYPGVDIFEAESNTQVVRQMFCSCSRMASWSRADANAVGPALHDGDTEARSSR
jgi:hypothetical protein